MYPNGLLILTQPVSVLRTQIARLLDQLAPIISDTVYIHLQPALHSFTSQHNSLLSPLACTTDVQSFITDVYGITSSHCQKLDIRILLSHITNKANVLVPVYKLNKPVSVLMSDTSFLLESWTSDRSSVMQLLQNSFCEGIENSLAMQQLDLTVGSTQAVEEKSFSRLTTYDYVVLGGTFDRLHSGHRLLLSQTCLLCDKQVTVGVTNEAMNARKTLKELITPQEEREGAVVEFIQDVKPSISVEPVCISDVYGPTIHRAEFQCLVLSQETAKGGAMINEERGKKGLQRLEVVELGLVEDTCRNPEEEEKVSSSSQRRRLLGTLLRPVLAKPHLPARPYRIGLTGGIASGKSNMCRELEKLGAAVIDCDLLGHQAYKPGTEGFQKVVAAFGEDLVTREGDIDRKKLGAIVFSDKSQLEKLNSIVWPEILKLVEKEIGRLTSEGVELVALEAAVLLEAGWDNSVHEVWTTFVPRAEAIRRIMDRNKLSEEEAGNRVDMQLSNTQRIARSNVAICPLWHFDYTRQQIQKAWTLLQERCPPSSLL